MLGAKFHRSPLSDKYLHAPLTWCQTNCEVSQAMSRHTQYNPMCLEIILLVILHLLLLFFSWGAGGGIPLFLLDQIRVSFDL